MQYYLVSSAFTAWGCYREAAKNIRHLTHAVDLLFCACNCTKKQSVIKTRPAILPLLKSICVRLICVGMRQFLVDCIQTDEWWHTHTQRKLSGCKFTADGKSINKGTLTSLLTCNIFSHAKCSFRKNCNQLPFRNWFDPTYWTFKRKKGKIWQQN